MINLSSFREKKNQTCHVPVLSPLTTGLPHPHLFSSQTRILNIVNFYFFVYLFLESLPTVTSIILPNSVSGHEFVGIIVSYGTAAATASFMISMQPNFREKQNYTA